MKKNIRYEHLYEKRCIFARAIKNINSTRSLYKDYTTLVKVLHEAGTSTTRSWYKEGSKAGTRRIRL
jgi:hypothetical protein